MQQLPSWQQDQWQLWQKQQSRLAHAFLLTDPESEGLPDFVQLMTASLLCKQATGDQQSTLTACGHCSQCLLLSKSTHPDVFRLTLEEGKKEVGIDQVRALNKKIFETSHQGGKKIAIIEMAEHLNQNAFNALLKSIEEPPQNTIIILTASKLGKLPATIKSRCQQIRFFKPKNSVALAWLAAECPQADDVLLKKSLKFNWGFPFQARQWITDKSYEFEQVWQSSLQSLMSGEKTITELVTLWKKQANPSVIFDYFYLWTVVRIRAALYQQKMPFQNQWMQFQNSVLLAKQVWHRNGNKDMVLESLCTEWLNLNKMTPEHINSELKSAFKSPLLRGQL